MLRIDNAQNRQKQSRKNKVGPHLSWGRLLILVRIWISGCLLILVRIWISGCLLTLVRIWISGCFFFLVRILVGLMDVFQFESQFGICWDTHRYWHDDNDNDNDNDNDDDSDSVDDALSLSLSLSLFTTSIYIIGFFFFLVDLFTHTCF